MQDEVAQPGSCPARPASCHSATIQHSNLLAEPAWPSEIVGHRLVERRGEGAFSYVYAAQHLASGALCALKVGKWPLEGCNDEDEVYSAWRVEVAAYSQLQATTAPTSLEPFLTAVTKAFLPTHDQSQCRVELRDNCSAKYIDDGQLAILRHLKAEQGAAAVPKMYGHGFFVDARQRVYAWLTLQLLGLNLHDTYHNSGADRTILHQVVVLLAVSKSIKLQQYSCLEASGSSFSCFIQCLMIPHIMPGGSVFALARPL